MSNYYRITAYHPEENISMIMDSNGLFEKLWQFSADLIQKGFRIVEVGNSEKFLEGEIDLAEPCPDNYLLRAYAKGKPTETTLTLNGVTYKAVCVEDRCYVPNKEKRFNLIKTSKPRFLTDSVFFMLKISPLQDFHA